MITSLHYFRECEEVCSKILFEIYESIESISLGNG